MDTEQAVVRHYTHGALEQAIWAALAAAGKDPDRLTPADLAPVDEFHIGGRQATVALADQLPFGAGAHLLDLGSGLGGASRYFAHQRQCQVTGIDLTEEFVHVAGRLAERVGLGEAVRYRTGSATDLPFAPQSFDGAYMLHVGMNIADKAALFAGVRRVLKPNGVFAIYDVMRTDVAGPLDFPVPWASGPETSFVESAATYRRLLEAAGFVVQAERDRHAFAADFFREMRARAAGGGGPPPLGLHIVMGPSTPQKVANMISSLERRLITPTEIISRVV
jgi:ubiquinone/menaquinone biosynthesis C-methylase UbiE